MRASAGWSDVGAVTATMNLTERGFYAMTTKKLFKNSTWCVYRIKTVRSNWFRNAKKFGRMCWGKKHQVSIPPQRKFLPDRQINSSNSWLGEHHPTGSVTVSSGSSTIWLQLVQLNTVQSITYTSFWQKIPFSSIQGESLARGPKLLSMYTVEQCRFPVRKYC